MANPSYAGSCHCGAIGFAYESPLPPEQWPVRCCDCSFCRAHGACCTSDPGGSVRFVISKPDHLLRYRFARRTADFLICRACGVYIGALITADRGTFGLVNLNAFVAPPDGLSAPKTTNYDAESGSRRVARREEGWTPVVGDI